MFVDKMQQVKWNQSSYQKLMTGVESALKGQQSTHCGTHLGRTDP
jgi:hypothetical protein